MTFKNQRTEYLVYVQSPPVQVCHNISGVAGPKFTKFVVIFINFVNATIPRCDPSTPCQMTGATFNEKKVPNVDNPAPKT